jgi:hypothetical protein
MDNSKSMIFNLVMKLVGVGTIIWMMVAIAHGMSASMTHALGTAVGNLPTP